MKEASGETEFMGARGGGGGRCSAIVRVTRCCICTRFLRARGAGMEFRCARRCVQYNKEEVVVWCMTMAQDVPDESLGVGW